MALFPQAWASQGIQLVPGEMEAGKPVGLVFFLLRFVEMSNGLQGLLRNTVEIAWQTSAHLSPELSRSLMPSSVASITFLSALHFTGSGCQGVSQTPGSFLRWLLFAVKLSRCAHRCPYELHTSSPQLSRLPQALAEITPGAAESWLLLRFLSCLLQPTQPYSVRVFKHFKRKKSPLLPCDTAWLCWVTSLGTP